MNTSKPVRIAGLIAVSSLLAACATMEGSGPKATATLESRSGSTVTGTVSFQTVGQVAGRAIAQARAGRLGNLCTLGPGLPAQ